ncbi:MAG: tetratricopeptide repeat protein [Actinomycetota bacterium]
MSSEAHLQRAVLYRDEGRFAEAFAEIALATEARVGYDDALGILAHTQLAAGDRDAAIATLERKLTAHRESAIETAIKLARYNSISHNYAAAAHWARLAVSLDPTDAFSQSMLACHLLGVEDYAGAEAAATEAVRLEPDDSSHYLNLAVAYEDQGKIEEAIDAYQTIIRLDPTDENAPEQLARIRRESSSVETA